MQPDATLRRGATQALSIMADLEIVASIALKRVLVANDQHAGWLPGNAASPLATLSRIVNIKFEIAHDGQGYLLIFQSSDGTLANDDWHASQPEAERRANAMFGVEQHEWERT